jgi:hypothetical protein
MHELHNTSKSVLTIPTANGRATIMPDQKKKFDVGILGAGLLKAVQGARSTLRLANLSGDAEAAAATALKNIKKKGFAIVHGSGDISVEEALAREKRARLPRPVQVRDEFTKAQAKSQQNLGPAPDENDGDPSEGGDGQDGGEGGGEGGAPTHIEEVHPASAVLKQVEENAIGLPELRAAAKQILGDAFPKGAAVGKDAIVSALRGVLEKKD